MAAMSKLGSASCKWTRVSIQGRFGANRCTHNARRLAQSLEQSLADKGAIADRDFAQPTHYGRRSRRRVCYAPKLTAADRQVNWRREAGSWLYRYVL